MTNRLSKLCFLPPPTGTPWKGPTDERESCEVPRLGGAPVKLQTPLFWHEPPWSRLSTDLADAVAVAVASQGVVVTALRRDLGPPDVDPDLHGGDPEAHAETTHSQSKNQPQKLMRLVPYRPERYGLTDRDFDGARLIDVRLAAGKDESGRHAYSADQIERWEATPEDEPLAGGSWVPSATFPPDVASLAQLGSKLNQLRALAPSAGVLVSINPHRLDSEIPKVLAAKPDGVILLLNRLETDDLELALVTRRARQVLQDAGAPDLPLWLVPGPVSADDVVKLMLLGATGVAIDDWCEEIIEVAVDELLTSPTSRYGRSSLRKTLQPQALELTETVLLDRIERVRGLTSATRLQSQNQRIGSLDRAWSKTLGVPWIGIGRDLAKSTK